MSFVNFTLKEKDTDTSPVLLTSVSGIGFSEFISLENSFANFPIDFLICSALFSDWRDLRLLKEPSSVLCATKPFSKDSIF